MQTDGNRTRRRRDGDSSDNPHGGGGPEAPRGVYGAHSAGQPAEPQRGGGVGPQGPRRRSGGPTADRREEPQARRSGGQEISRTGSSLRGPHPGGQHWP